MIRSISRARTFSLFTAFVACLFAGYLVALTPHLVHHLFDDDQDQTSCPYLAQSQHTPPAGSDPAPALALIAIGHVAALPDPTALPFAERTTVPSRAPPVSFFLA